MARATGLLTASICVSLFSLILTGCNKPLVHGSGYGGTDFTLTVLNSTRQTFIANISRFLAAKKSASLCEPVNCEQYPRTCQILKAAQSDEKRSAYLSDFLANNAVISKWQSIATEAKFAIVDEPLIQDGVGVVDGLTPLSGDSQGPIQFNRSRISKMSEEVLLLVLSHEALHLATHIQDAANMGPFVGRELLDVVAACLNIPPSATTTSQTNAKIQTDSSKSDSGQSDGTPKATASPSPEASPSPSASPSPTPEPSASPSPTPSTEPSPTPTPVCQTTVISRETTGGLKASMGDAAGFFDPTLRNRLTVWMKKPQQLFITDQFQQGDKLILESVYGVSIARIHHTEPGGIAAVSSCPKNWTLRFRNASGQILNNDPTSVHLAKDFSAGVALPAASLKLWLGYRENCLNAGSQCDTDGYFDNEGIRSTNNPTSTGGCMFTFRVERTTCQ